MALHELVSKRGKTLQVVGIRENWEKNEIVLELRRPFPTRMLQAWVTNERNITITRCEGVTIPKESDKEEKMYLLYITLTNRHDTRKLAEEFRRYGTEMEDQRMTGQRINEVTEGYAGEACALPIRREGPTENEPSAKRDQTIGLEVQKPNPQEPELIPDDAELRIEWVTVFGREPILFLELEQRYPAERLEKLLRSSGKRVRCQERRPVTRHGIARPSIRVTYDNQEDAFVMARVFRKLREIHLQGKGVRHIRVEPYRAKAEKTVTLPPIMDSTISRPKRLERTVREEKEIDDHIGKLNEQWALPLPTRSPIEEGDLIDLRVNTQEPGTRHEVGEYETETERIMRTISDNMNLTDESGG